MALSKPVKVLSALVLWFAVELVKEWVTERRARRMTRAIDEAFYAPAQPPGQQFLGESAWVPVEGRDG